jgi:DNA-binding NarL/FixJ family response regulator
MVRVDFPTAFGQGFECFMFCGRHLSDADDPKRIAYTAFSVWPVIKAEVVSKRYDITAREMEVLLALAEGLTVKEACERVGCAERTIGFHLANLQEKLRASNRAAVVQRACALGLL